jgi:hypothetical protein
MNCNQAELRRNQAGKIPICLARNRRKKCFDGNSLIVAVHVSHPDWTLRALDLPTNRLRIAIRLGLLRFECYEFAILRRQMPIENHRLRGCRRKIPCFFLLNFGF